MSKTYTIGKFPSRILRRRHIRDFVCTETVYDPDQQVSTHSHESACIVINLQGSFTENSGNREYFCESTDFLFRPPGDPHSNYFHHKGAKCLTVEISSAWLSRARRVDLELDWAGTLHLSDSTLSPLASRLYREFVCFDTASTLAIEGLVLEMLAAVSRAAYQHRQGVDPARGGDRIAKARDVITDRFGENLTLGDIACSIDVHPAHLAREFRRHMGCTVGEYIRQMRIKLACAELAHGDVPLAAIALNCGFSDQSHFSRVFKKQTGMSPSRYRTNLLKR